MQASGSTSNVALQGGWTPEEIQILKICLMKFGLGRWTALVK